MAVAPPPPPPEPHPPVAGRSRAASRWTCKAPRRTRVDSPRRRQWCAAVGTAASPLGPLAPPATSSSLSGRSEGLSC